MTISGTDYTNYTLSQPSLTADITVRSLTVTANSFNKTQGIAFIFAGNEFNVTNLATGDAVTSATITSLGASSGAVVNTYPTDISNAVGTGLSNYSISYVNGVLTVINKAQLTITGLTASNKTYNGNTSATISNWGTLQGVTGGDVVTLNTTSAVASFNNKTVGTGKTVTVTGLTLSGTDANKYYINNQQTTANITAKQLSISGLFTVDNKTYNGNNSAVINQNNLTLLGVEGADVVSLSTVTAQFNDATIGNSKTVSITSAILNGADINNYTLTLTGAPTTTANILAVQHAVNVSKTGNGTTTPTSGLHLYNDGTSVPLTATPDGGWIFEKWIVNGVDVFSSTTDLNIDKAYTVEAVFSLSTSIRTIEDFIIEVFPNPTSGLVNIKSNKITDQISVSSISGQMFEPNLIQNELSYNIDLGNYPDGLYILRIKSEGNIYFIKVLKQ